MFSAPGVSNLQREAAGHAPAILWNIDDVPLLGFACVPFVSPD